MRSAAIVGIFALLGTVSGAEASTLRVRVAPDSGSCSAEQIAQALRLRRSGDPVVAGGAAGPSDVDVAVSHADGRWVLEVANAGGQSPLHRDLPAPSADCVQLCDIAAVMVDRYLEEVHWTRETVVLAPLPPPEPPTPAVPLHLRLELGAGAETGIQNARAQFALAAGLERGPFWLGVGVDGSTQEVAPLSDGSTVLGHLFILGSRIRAVGGWLHRLGPGDIRFEGALGVALWRASGDGGFIFHPSPVWQAEPTTGLRAGYQLDLPARFWVAAMAEAQLALGLAKFGVRGVPETVNTPRWQGALTLSVGRTFF